MTATTTISERLSSVRTRIAAACDRAGRDPADVTLVAVTKTHPIELIGEAVEAGLTELGENRAQEFVPKAEATAAQGLTPNWHFIGHLQRNKARQVLPHATVLHSVDSERLIAEVERRATRPLTCYLEVNVSGEASKAGIAPDALPSLLQVASDATNIELAGLMTVAPRVDDPEQVRPVFQRLRELAQAHGLTGLSMGMTDDYTVAIEEGATVVRVGRAIFGERRT
jgi:pyridoxal phosphate enzyme (YggS family)